MKIARDLFKSSQNSSSHRESGVLSIPSCRKAAQTSNQSCAHLRQEAFASRDTSCFTASVLIELFSQKSLSGSLISHCLCLVLLKAQAQTGSPPFRRCRKI
jgi:hypothetical protein